MSKWLRYGGLLFIYLSVINVPRAFGISLGFMVDIILMGVLMGAWWAYADSRTPRK